MKKSYNSKKIEAKWQKEWAKNGVYRQYDRKKKFYVLDMFPYPSGAGLHVGHPKGYIATDVIARMKQLQGYSVLHPMGWDAFGLPAEQYALKNKVHPEKAVRENIKTFKKQLGKIGFTYDWEREINTTDPDYYKWTQWIFLQMWKKGLAYESNDPINWCPKCLTGLANEDLEQGKCERCGSVVEKRPLRQWVLRMTEYADRLLYDLDPPAGGEKLEWSESIKEQQRNWIGRSEGAEMVFFVADTEEEIRVYTTRVDTIFGCTYLVLAPEHSLVAKLLNDKFQTRLPDGQVSNFKNKNEVKRYVRNTERKSDLERTELAKEKTGVELQGIEAIHPFTGKRLPVYVADYVLGGYGTGAVMGVPAHDTRDFEFAKKYELDIDTVIVPSIELAGARTPRKGKEDTSKNCVTGLIFDTAGKKVLVLKNKQDGARMFVGGGIDDGETPEQAIIRETREETGYRVKIDSPLIASMYGRGYKPHKDVNCFDHDVVFVAHAINTTADKISSEEQEIHEVYWENTEDVVKIGLLEHHAFMWRMYLGGEQAFIEDGILIDSKEFSGMTSAEAREKMTAWLVKEKLGKKKVNYKMRDWTFSRQRYWGEPIPLVHCGKCGVVAVPERDLPVKLPKVKSYEPTNTGESPLASIASWVNVKCPKCKGKAKRETNTMPQWAGSSWYYLAYVMRGISNFQFPISKYKKAFDHLIPVDVYVGGTEHATRHLLYARFWHKFLYDIKAVSGKEPFKKLVNQGLILATDGRKMSKRWGNVINPDDMVAQFGADAFRVYEMFMGPFTQSIAWNTDGVVGTRRFLEKVWKLQEKVTRSKEKVVRKNLIDTLLHQTIKKVTEDIENFKFNTAISALMILVNALEKEDRLSLITYQTSLLLLSPFAPHIAEELWSATGEKKSIFLAQWPKWDAKKIVEEMKTIVVQVNGKVRATFEMPTGSDEETVKTAALENAKVQTHIAGKEIRKVIYIQDKILNLVVG